MAEEKEQFIKQFKIYQAPLMSVGKSLNFCFTLRERIIINCSRETELISELIINRGKPIKERL